MLYIDGKVPLSLFIGFVSERMYHASMSPLPNMDFEPISQHHPRRCCGPIESSAPPLQRGWGQHSTELVYVHYDSGSVYIQFGPHRPCHNHYMISYTPHHLPSQVVQDSLDGQECL